MHNLMSYVAGKTSRTLRRHGCHWQDGLHDTEIRGQRQFNYVIDYIHYNPVNRGLVRLPEHWDATSARQPDWVTLAWL